uniref:nucleoside diphosphate phosphatase n=1 Tax=Cyanistes caeruleus TaxID=156563 RepID=A0A8C0UWX4_CYACU
MEAMKISKRFFAFGILTCIAVYVAYIKWHLGSKPFVGATEGAAESRGDKLTHQAVTTDLSVFYGIMFDAGSTGTRIHIFKFAQQSRETPRLTHETFKALKPGLSAYADDVEKSGQGIKELLEVAKKEVPMELWKFTPLVLKATAGLRLLPGEKAQKLLEKVKEIFQASPFFVRDNCVSIMNGTDEGISAWITINFLTGEPLYESCSNKVAKMLYKKVHRAGEVKDLDFYIFSYYYDCAAEAGLIDKEKGGSLTVNDFEIAAKYVCKTMEISPGNSPFLCMDLTYITFLLQELGFPKSQGFKLARKIDNVETSWALGATFHYIDSLNRLQY